MFHKYTCRKFLNYKIFCSGIRRIYYEKGWLQDYSVLSKAENCGASIKGPTFCLCISQEIWSLVSELCSWNPSYCILPDNIMHPLHNGSLEEN